MTKPCCYIYLDNDKKVAYVGKANGTLEARIKAHAKEKKFIDCKCEFEIRYQVFDKPSDMDAAEKTYIKSLKPYLNVTDSTTGFFPSVQFDASEWIKYDPAVKTEKEEPKAKKKYTSYVSRNDPRREILYCIDFLYSLMGCGKKSFVISECFYEFIPPMLKALIVLFLDEYFLFQSLNNDYIVITINRYKSHTAQRFLYWLKKNIVKDSIEPEDKKWIEQQYFEFRLRQSKGESMFINESKIGLTTPILRQGGVETERIED